MIELLTNGIAPFSDGGIITLLGAVICAALPFFLGGVRFTRIIGKETKLLLILGNALDALKGALCACIGLMLMRGDEYAYVALFFCIVGHTFSPYEGFKGGSPLFCAVGACLILNSIVTPAVIIIYFILYVITRKTRTSLYIAAALFPILNFQIYFLFISSILKLAFSAACALCVCLAATERAERFFSDKKSEKT